MQQHSLITISSCSSLLQKSSQHHSENKKMRFLFDWTMVLLLLLLLLIVTVTVTTTAKPSNRIRGARQDHPHKHGARQEQNKQQDQGRRHHLPADTECTLYKKDTQWGDGHKDTVWSCEFTTEQVTVMEAGLGLDSSAGIMDMLDVDSITTNELIDDAGVISGTTILKSSDLTVEPCNETGVMKLVVPKDVKLYVLKELSEDDGRHYTARRARRRTSALQSGRDYGHRNLANSMGILETLVVRVIANNGNEPASEMQLYDDIFDDSSSLKSQYGECSKDQLTIIPAPGYGSSTEGTTGAGNSDRTGIVNVNVDVESSSDRTILELSAVSAAEKTYGILKDNYDLVLFCQPSKFSGNWVAYAYVNGYRSFYNDFWCSRMSALVHEVGHNLGLHHSGADINGVYDPYGDESGMMGSSYKKDDGPDKCFNAAKNYQLGWYDNQRDSYNPLNDNIGKTKNYIMNGVNEYKVDALASNGEIITLRLENENDGQNDYYIGYNRANGPNEKTSQAINKILIVQKPTGGPKLIGESKKISELTVGQSFRIENYENTQYDVIITYESVTSNLRDATISIRTIDILDVPSSLPNSIPSFDSSTAPSLEPSLPQSTVPSSVPSGGPSGTPSFIPSSEPISLPSAVPSHESSLPPSTVPSSVPSGGPSDTPSFIPSSEPISLPSAVPSPESSLPPSTVPSSVPSGGPSGTPSFIPSSEPISLPSAVPIHESSLPPSTVTSDAPSGAPSSIPSSVPSPLPSVIPSAAPSSIPSLELSLSPSSTPSLVPSLDPSATPSSEPSVLPSAIPSDVSSVPSLEPSLLQSTEPSSAPNADPTGTLSSIPSAFPSHEPSRADPNVTPNFIPSSEPSSLPSAIPSHEPSLLPNTETSSAPSGDPTGTPSFIPRSEPSSLPSSTPTFNPSLSPSAIRSSDPISDTGGVSSSQPSDVRRSIQSSVPMLSPSRAPNNEPSAAPISTPSPSFGITDAPSFVPNWIVKNDKKSKNDKASKNPPIAPQNKKEQITIINR